MIDRRLSDEQHQGAVDCKVMMVMNMSDRQVDGCRKGVTAASALFSAIIVWWTLPNLL